MAQYFKKRKNTIGLGKGVEVNSTTFTDKDIEGHDPKVLKRVIAKGWIEVLSGEQANALNNQGKSEEVEALESKVKDLEKQLKDKDAELQSLEDSHNVQGVLIGELKAALYKGYDEMTAEELAEEFTVNELKDIGTTYLKLTFKGNPKEATIAQQIVEAVKAGK